MSDIKYDKRIIAHIVIEAETPLVISSGGRTPSTDAPILKDVNGFPYIPGTSIAGVLRHTLGEDKARSFFGFKEDKTTRGSEIIFSEAKLVWSDGKIMDGLIDTGSLDNSWIRRFSRLSKRNHVCLTAKGVAKDKGKFDEEVIYKGTRFAFDIEMVLSSKDNEATTHFNDTLAELRKETFRIGGGSRSGFGKVNIVSIRKKEFDLHDTNDLSEYLACTSYITEHPVWEEVETDKTPAHGWIRYDLTLTPIDFFSFGSGLGDNEVDDTPVRESFISWKNGSGEFKDKAVLIPASSLKGALSHRTAFHHNLRRGIFAMNVYSDDLENNSGNHNDAVRTLFGYQNMKETEVPQKCGACLFHDIIIEDGTKEKILNHVSIDRFTSGAIDGALFSEKVLYGKNLKFTTTILVKKPASDSKEFNEAIECLELSFKDIDMGTLPLGGGSGRGHGIFNCKYKKTEL